MLNHSKKSSNHEMDLEHCLVEPSYDLARRKMPLFYKKLVVPMRMRSVYWKYFGFPAGDDGTILTKEKIVCVLCKTQMIYNRNTSNLRMHLHSKHRNIFQKLEMEEGEKGINIVNGNKRIKAANSKNVYSRNVDGSIEFTSESVGGNRKSTDSTKDVQVVMTEEVSESDISNIAIIFPTNEELSEYNEDQIRSVNHESNEECSEINDVILNFIITDLLPTNVVDGKGFHNLLSSLGNKSITLNERKLVEDLLPNLYNSYKEQVYNSIVSNLISNISISVEEWTCDDDVKCLSIYMHYLQNGEPRLFTKLLTTIYCTGLETVEHWNTIFDKLFEEWSINGSAITGVILSSDNKHLKEALLSKNIVVLPCFLFILQKLCSNHCFSHPEVASVLEKCRQIVKLLQELKNGYCENIGMDPEDDDYDENDDISLNYDRPDLWFTTYYMLRGIMKRKNSVIQMTNDSCRGPVLQTSEWKNIEDLVNLLEPLKTIVITLFEEKNPSISLVKPLIWKVNSANFETNSDDSLLLQHLKTAMKLYLNEAYSDDTVDNLTQVATTLDPRFKSFIQQDENFNGGEGLADLLNHLVDTEGSFSPEETSTIGKASSADKNRRSSGINVLFGNFCVNKPKLTIQDKIKMEVQYYQTSSGALLEECPLEWWQQMNNKCPNLIRLAHKYHCVPAIVIFSNNRSIREYTTFYYKRTSLKINVLDQLIFLHSNRLLS